MLKRVIYVCFVILSLTPLLGQADLYVTSSSGDGNNYVLFNDGKGNYSDTQQVLGNTISLSAAFADVDNDGDVDIVDASDPGARIYINDGQGNLTATQILGQDLPITRSIALADVDGDEDFDLILGVADSQFTSNSQLFINDGQGTFTFKETIGSNHTRSIAVADLNGDTFPDIYEGIQDDADLIWFNDGTGSFSDSGQTLSQGPTFAVSLGDVNGDGHLDAFVALDGPANEIWLNNGSGVFTQSPQVFPGTNSLACAMADIDKDGDLDLIVGNDGAVNFHPPEIWINDGSGSFAAGPAPTNTYRTVGTSLGDADGDGDLDLYLANLSPDKIYLNSGTGIFADSGLSLPATLSHAGIFVYLKHDFDNAIAAWDDSYTVVGLLQFMDQLQARNDHQRGR